MHRLIPFVVAVVVASCARAVNVEQEKAALLAVDADWSKTVNDVDKFASYLAPDVSFGMAGMPEVKGHQAVKEMVAGMSKAPGFKLSWNATRADVGTSGDLGYTVGTYELTANNAAGMAATERGKYITAWKKVSGAWKVVADYGGGDAPVLLSSPAVVTPAANVKWMDAPPFLEPGAKIAVLVGDPSKPEPFTLRLQMPDGYKIAPHTHPTDEHVTVLSGTFLAAMGKAWDDKALGDFAPGSYANMAAQMAHFAQAKGVTVVQVHGVGPFVVNYVNPADDPSKKK